jgi:hypothetical protein
MSLLLLFNAQTDVLISGTAGVGLAGSMTIRVFAGCGAIGRAGSMLRENLFKTAQGSTGRASTATYLDETGIMRLAGVDVARIDHNPAPPYRSFDLLLEAASTNFIPNANTVSVGTLSVSSTDIPRLYVDATLWKVTSNGAGMPAYYIGVPITPNVAYTASMWVYIPSGYAG